MTKSTSTCIVINALLWNNSFFFSVNPPKKRRRWLEEAMTQAYDCVMNGLMSTNAAEKKFNVPRMTLTDRLSGRIAIDAELGRPTALSSAEEACIEKYTTYMAHQLFPLTRSQVMGLAWALDIRKEVKERKFGDSGPSLKWLKGFRNRHPDLTLGSAECVDRGRHENAKESIILEYFDTLSNLLTEKNLQNKPHLIYNCDETAIMLNKAASKVVVPRKFCRCHTVATATSEHISMLCCFNACGKWVPPLIVLKKSMPSSRTFQNEGPPNALYGCSDSGFVDRQIYVEWFLKGFLPSLPK